MICKSEFLCELSYSTHSHKLHGLILMRYVYKKTGSLFRALFIVNFILFLYTK